MVEHSFRDRPLSPLEIEVLQLVLSTFRDGSGQVILKTGGSMPGFRDYERALAAVVRGKTTENKGVFDIVVSAEPLSFGISCKMSRFQPPANHCAFMELSNAAAAFRNHLLNHQVHWMSEPTLAGPLIIDLVTSWHEAVSGDLDAPHSKYAVLSHDATWQRFQVHSFPLDLRLANPRGQVEWTHEGKSLNGYTQVGGRRHRLWQCFMTSGGQLKYYPPLEWADWSTPEFALLVPPVESLLKKAEEYFGHVWPPAWVV